MRLPFQSSEAVKWLRKAAEQGVAEAQSWFGLCYANGDGVAKDKAEAVKWYRKSAEQGSAWAQNRIGLCYENGTGVDINLTEALKWYHRAADQGYAEAHFRLGEYYYSQLGLSKKGGIATGALFLNRRQLKNSKFEDILKSEDGKTMMTHYKAAADAGHEKAKKRIKQLSKYM